MALAGAADAIQDHLTAAETEQMGSFMSSGKLNWDTLNPSTGNGGKIEEKEFGRI